MLVKVKLDANLPKLKLLRRPIEGRYFRDCVFCVSLSDRCIWLRSYKLSRPITCSRCGLDHNPGLVLYKNAASFHSLECLSTKMSH
jgi:hypothetical protein